MGIIARRETVIDPRNSSVSREWAVVEVLGRFRNASNATLLARTDTGRLVVYKPERGQRPLHDFDCRTLPVREVVTFEVSQAAGIGSVPETRPAEGPFGPGSAQMFVEVDEGFDPAPLINETDDRLWPVVTLDLIINNADRKAGHVLADHSGRLWYIDHGVTLHVEPKLRTVMWGFAGHTLPDGMVAGVRKLRDELDHGLHDRIAELLSGSEADALADRVERILAEPVHPYPPTDRPPLPWPIW